MLLADGFKVLPLCKNIIKIKISA